MEVINKMFDISLVLKGLAAGVTYSLALWSKKEHQKFEWTKFGTTAAVGAIAGVVMAFMEVDIATAYAMLIAAGATGIVESLIKAIYRKIITKIY